MAEKQSVNVDVITQWMVLQSALERVRDSVENEEINASQFRQRMRDIKQQMNLVESLLIKCGILPEENIEDFLSL